MANAQKILVGKLGEKSQLGDLIIHGKIKY
jgi:hypothetical protein